ncbi:hypothetical protein F503_06748 [Ophiostoma piceae UAMH 11346]|uniref:Uncharacterized protein n=1 Tax=Ophiostoma piceae (strain UAMH 11346) TaxID=1262450 RepID=S3CPC6_OPHP1|nr:hypothetical protein F503_06748 [Ophiostoma piceae UAMH 11346]
MSKFSQMADIIFPFRHRAILIRRSCIAALLPGTHTWSLTSNNSHFKKRFIHVSDGCHNQSQMASATPTKMDNSGEGPLRVPGFGGMPMTFQLPANSRFAHGFNEWRQSPIITAQEQAMVIVMNRLTDKPGWSELIFDDETVAQWRAELDAERAQTRQCKDTSGKTLTDVFLANPRLLRGATWDWCVQELRDKARDFRERGHVRVLDTGSCVCKADSLDLGALAATMRREVEPLASAVTEQTGRHQKPVIPQAEQPREDVHRPPEPVDVPNPDTGLLGALDREFLTNWYWKPSHLGPVLDIDGSAHLIKKLVDPLKFPLVYGKSLVLEKGGAVSLEHSLESYAGATIPMLPDMTVPKRNFDETDNGTLSNDNEWCKKYQCLPFDVAFRPASESNATSTVRITSYINDIHPDYKKLYAAIESVLSRCIEPWNDCIMPGHADAYNSDISCQLGRVPLRIITFGIEHINTLPGWADAFDLNWNRHMPPNDSELWKLAKEYLERPDRLDVDSVEPLPGLTDWAPGDKRTAYLLRQKIKACLERFDHPEPGTAFSYDEWRNGRHRNRAIIEEVPPYMRYACGQKLRNATQAPRRGLPDPEKCAFLPLQDHFHDTGLQVFAEIQSIELTPEELSYAPDASDRSASYTEVALKLLKDSLAKNDPVELNENSDMDGWRIAGRLNEHVSAVAVFVFDAENITPPRIAFQQNTECDYYAYWKYAIGGPPDYDPFDKYESRHNPLPDDTATLGELFHVPQLGMFTDLMMLAEKSQFPMSVALLTSECELQDGSQIESEPTSSPKETKSGQGRLVTFPNVVQHRIEPFQLRDNTRPGRLRWLTLYLVDPNYRICSTRNVPPQNRDWWAESASRLLARNKMPQELVDQILSHTDDWPMAASRLQHHGDSFSIRMRLDDVESCCENQDKYSEGDE